MKTIVIYHRADFDGLFCREIARKFYGDAATYIGWDYGDPAPVVPEDGQTELILLDISVPELMNHEGLCWIDHHKSAIDKYKASGYQIDGVAACRLAWQWFFTYNNRRNPLADHFATLPTKEDFIDRKVSEPLAVRLAGEYDIWDKRDPRAELFQHGLRSCDLAGRWALLLSPNRKPSIAEIEKMMDNGNPIQIGEDGEIIPPIIASLLKKGEAIQYAKNHENESIIRSNGFDLLFADLRFLACNAARYSSHLFAAGYDPLKHDALLGFNYDGQKRKWRISLYGAPGKPDFDLAAIAVRYGGGGHKQACGFAVDKLPFEL